LSTITKEHFLKQYRYFFIPVLSLIIVTAAVLSSVPVQAAKPVKVAVLPFTIHSEKNLAFLQEGIMDMLASRLAWQDRVDVLEKTQVKQVFKEISGFTGESRALMAGGKLQADYVLFGSVTVLGQNASIDARLVDVSGKNDPMPFAKQVQGLGQIIPEINRFATAINESVFNRESAVGPIRQAQRKDAGKTGEKSGPSFIAGNQEQSPRSQDQLGAPNKDFITVQQTARQQDFFKSRPFKFRITGVAAGDIDNDGRIETVLLSDHAVHIYRGADNGLARIATIGKNRINSHIAVDVADINQNGTPEIFVSSLVPDNDRLKSFVLEFNGSEYREIAEDMNRYFRVITRSINGKTTTILLAQEQNKGKGPFEAPIYQIETGSNHYLPGKRVVPGGHCNVLGVTTGDLTGNGEKNIIGFNSKDYIKVFTAGSGTIWKDHKKRGGTLSSVRIPTNDPTDEDGAQYLPARLILRDTNGDGKDEVITAANFNNGITSGMLSKYRKFKTSRLESLNWDGMALATYWKTKQAQGRISDFSIADFDNDGTVELILGRIVQEGTVAFTSAKSFLVGYNL